MSVIKKVLNVNGEKHTLELNGDEKLVWVLRDKLKLTGTKFGCGQAVCGACSVLIDGKVKRSCIVPVGSLTRRNKIVTIEGLAVDGKLSAVQQAFIDHNAFCCGFCTPGMIITATALLLSNPDPSEDEIIKAMDSNICRCASYPNIIKAVKAAAGQEG